MLAAYKPDLIDLNFGCPAKEVTGVQSGSALMRQPELAESLVAAAVDAVDVPLTVKMRLGFDDTANFDRILGLVEKHSVDLLSVHGRTVKEMYRSEVHYEFIAHAVRRVRCPTMRRRAATWPAISPARASSTRAWGRCLRRLPIRAACLLFWASFMSVTKAA